MRTEQTDQELYQAFREGDIPAFEALVLRHRHHLVYFTLQYTRNFHAAEDIAQEVFAYLYVHPGRYDPQYVFQTFLFTVAKRRAIDWLRKEGKRAANADVVDEAHADQETLEEIVFRREESAALAQAVGRLKQEYRQALWLTEWNGLSLADTAAVMGKTTGAVKVLAHRARKALRKEMEKGGTGR